MKVGYVITALDIGTSKICAIIAKVTKDRFMEIKGIGIGPSVGLENGQVKNMEGLSNAIESVLEQAETMAEIPAKNIFVGISGEHVKSQNSVGQIAISTNNTPVEITKEDIENVKTNAKNNVQLKNQDRQHVIIHAIPQYFEVDGRSGIINPINMSAFNLKAYFHVVMADKISVENIKKCVYMAGYSVEQIVLEPLASSYVVLNSVEKKLGSILLDIGGGTTDIAVFSKDSIVYTGVLQLGGSNITADLTVGLRTSPQEAEHIKISSGNTIANTIPHEKLIEIKGIGGREPRQKKLRYVGEIIEARMREILDAAYTVVNENVNLNEITAGLTITGGTSLLKNIEFLAEEVFNMSTKIGYPDTEKLKGSIDNLNHPKYATSIGILYYVYNLLKDKELVDKKYTSNKSIVGFFNKIIKMIKDFFAE